MGPYDDILAEAAAQFNLDPQMLARMLQTESSGDPNAVSPRGATGLMQLMPPTAAGLGLSEEDLLDPRKNIMGGAQYKRQLLDQFTNDPVGNLSPEIAAAAAYNAGPGNVRKYGGIPPFEETQNYIKRVYPDYSAEPVEPQEEERWSEEFGDKDKLTAIKEAIGRGKTGSEVRELFGKHGFTFPEDQYRDEIERIFDNRATELDGLPTDIESPTPLGELAYNIQDSSARVPLAMGGGALQIPKFIADIPGYASKLTNWFANQGAAPFPLSEQEQGEWDTASKALMAGEWLLGVTHLSRAGDKMVETAEEGATGPVKTSVKVAEIYGENLDLLVGGLGLGKAALNKFVLMDDLADLVSKGIASYSDEVVRASMHERSTSNLTKFINTVVPESKGGTEAAARAATETLDAVFDTHMAKIAAIDDEVKVLREMDNLTDILDGVRKDILGMMVDEARSISRLDMPRADKIEDIKAIRKQAQIVSKQSIPKDTPRLPPSQDPRLHMAMADSAPEAYQSTELQRKFVDDTAKELMPKSVKKEPLMTRVVDRMNSILPRISSKAMPLERAMNKAHIALGLGGRSPWPVFQHKLRDLGNYAANDLFYKTYLMDDTGKTVWTGNGLTSHLQQFPREIIEDAEKLGIADRHLLDGLTKMKLHERMVTRYGNAKRSNKRIDATVRFLTDKQNLSQEDGIRLQSLLRARRVGKRALEKYRNEISRYRFSSDPETTLKMQQLKNNIQALYGNDTTKLEKGLGGLREWSVRSILDKFVDAGAMTAPDKERLLVDNQYYMKMLHKVDEVASKASGPKRVRRGNEPKKDLTKWGSAVDEAGVHGPIETMASRAVQVSQWYTRQKSVNSFVDTWHDLVKATDRSEAERITGISLKRLKRKPLDGEEVIEYWQDGKRHLYTSDADTMAMLNDSTMAPYAKAFTDMASTIYASQTSRVFRNTATATLAFAAKNIMRDTQMGFLLARYGNRLVVDTMAGLFHMVRGKNAMVADELERVSTKFFQDGYGLSNITAIDSPMAPHNLEAMLATGGFEKYIQKWGSQGSTIEKVFYPMESIAKISDIATRMGMLGRLQKMKKAGKTLPRVAADKATQPKKYGIPKEVLDENGGHMNWKERYDYWRTPAGAPTESEMMDDVRRAMMDFNEFGEWGRMLNSYYAFTNPKIRETVQIGRALKDHPISFMTQWTKLFGVPTTLLWLKNRDNPHYAAVPDWQKNIFWHIDHNEKTGKWFVIPKPHMLGVLFSSGFEHALQQGYKGENGNVMVETLKQAFLDATPIPGSQALATGDPRDFWTGIAPTMAAGPMEVGQNFDQFRRMPIDPEYEVSGVTGPGRVSEYTSPSMEKLSIGLRDLNSNINISPNQLQHLIESYTTRYGQGAITLIDDVLETQGLGNRVPSLKELEPVPDILNHRGVRGLYKTMKGVVFRPGGSGTSSQQVRQFRERVYNNAEDIAAVERLQKNGDLVGARTIMEGNPLAIPKVGKSMLQITQKISELSDKIRQKQKILGGKLNYLSDASYEKRSEIFSEHQAEIIKLKDQQIRLGIIGNEYIKTAEKIGIDILKTIITDEWAVMMTEKQEEAFQEAMDKVMASER